MEEIKISKRKRINDKKINSCQFHQVDFKVYFIKEMKSEMVTAAPSGDLKGGKRRALILPLVYCSFPFYWAFTDF